MERSILKKLIRKNQFPIIFVGAGISKRYLKNYPSWIELLEGLWKEVEDSEGFYEHMLSIEDVVKEEWGSAIEYNDEKLAHEVNTRIASEIEKRVNLLFRQGKISIDNLTAKDVYNKKISPFKKLIANKFATVEVKEEMLEEYNEFKKMLDKAQVVMTTNYDPLIEVSCTHDDGKLEKYIGEKGLFGQAAGVAELYKLHGCYSDVDSIIITKEDYEKFDKNSVLISAKIISLLLHSPIIFLGYSLTDTNIRKIMKDFTKSLSDRELMLLEDNLMIVDWCQGEDKVIEEIENDVELGCRYNVIKTDNYSEVYRSISQVDQGISPIEVRKYLHVIKDIIVQEGAKGNLKKVLVGRADLNEVIDNGFKDKNMVVAIGDRQLVYVMPTLTKYIYNYIKGEEEQNLDATLRFILYQSGNLPCIKYLTEENINKSSLWDDEKDRLKKKLSKKQNIKDIIKGVSVKGDRFSSIADIEAKKYKEYYETGCIVKNILNIDREEIKEYLLDKLRECIRNKKKPSSGLRKIALAYDLIENSKTDEK